MKQLLSAFVIILVASSAIAAQNQQIQQKLPALEKLNGKFSFVVIGDNRSGNDIYRKLAAMIRERNPDFVVNTGDVITNPGDRRQWAGFWKMSKPITVPYFLTVGNHDVSAGERSSEKIYKEQVDLPGNELYYSFTAGNSIFIVLDAQLEGQEQKITGGQSAWLAGVLAGSKQRHKFVFVHHPLYPEKGRGKHHGNSLDRYKNERDRLQSLFRKYDVSMVFTGHEHLYLRKSVDGVTHVITGGGGAPLYAHDNEGGFYHFVRVIIDGEKVKAEVIDGNGKVRDTFYR